MVRYYYTKYNTVTKTKKEYRIDFINDSPTSWDQATGTTLYTMNYDTGMFAGFGSTVTIYKYQTGGTREVYSVDYPTIRRYRLDSNGIIHTADGKLSQVDAFAGYSRGTLVQSNIPAENGTYPADGRHSDGYWYVRGSEVNEAPTTPGAFTNPTGDLEIGDTKTISWGASTDVNGNLSGYTLEVAIDGGSYTQIDTPSSPSSNYTIPTATSLKFRVRARDSQGAVSSYRESALFTVTKPKYYYSKYNNTTTSSYSNPRTVYEEYGSKSASNTKGHGSAVWSSSEFKFDTTNGWRATPTYVIQKEVGSIYYQVSDEYIYRVQVDSFDGTYWHCTYTHYVRRADRTSTNSRGSLNQSGIIAEDGTYPTNGRHSDGYWYIRNSRVNQTIAPPSPFTAPAPGTILLPGVSHQLTFGASPVSGATYELQRSRDEGTTWSDIAKGSTDLTRNVTEGVDASKPTIQYRVRAKNSSNVYSDWVYSEVFILQHNVAPTLVLNTEDGKTLYENDSFIIDGSTIDSDPDQSVTVYYQINDEPRKVLTTNLSKVTIPFNKQLLFKSGKLLDGETAITGELTDGVAHTLKVWSQDSEGAESIPEIRLFYVVPNRAPTLVINDFTTEGTIDSDKFTIAGTAGDPDANSNVKVTYRINANNSVEVYNGPGGDFNFEVYFKDLKIGSNSIIVEAIDNYGAKYSKTIKLDKSEVSTPLLKSTARYKVQPPTGSAKGLLLWVRRSINLDVDVKISMTLTGEQESFVAMTLENTANITTDTVEDEFFYEVLEPKDNIILQLDLTRSSVDVDDSITLISGVLE